MRLSVIFACHLVVFVLSQCVCQMDEVYCTKTIQNFSVHPGKNNEFTVVLYIHARLQPSGIPLIVLLHVANTAHLAT